MGLKVVVDMQTWQLWIFDQKTTGIRLFDRASIGEKEYIIYLEIKCMQRVGIWI